MPEAIIDIQKIFENEFIGLLKSKQKFSLRIQFVPEYKDGAFIWPAEYQVTLVDSKGDQIRWCPRLKILQNTLKKCEELCIAGI